jgi:enoyl-CoA hydratase/carnithine racemase
MSIIKEQVRRDADGTLDAALENSQRLMLAAFERPDQAEGVSAHQAGRAPDFAPLEPAD